MERIHSCGSGRAAVWGVFLFFLDFITNFSGDAGTDESVNQVERKNHGHHIQNLLLQEDEWHLLQLRKEGTEWADIARQLGGTPEGLRKRLARAVARVTQALGLVEVVHV